MKKRPISMLDVAAYSQVSHQTVSRVLNNHKNVSVKTRSKVLAAMKELGYAPNLAARALSNGKTTTIGVLSYNSILFGPASMLHAVQNAAREIGYTVTLATTKGVDESAISTGIRELVQSGVDGIILITPLTKGSQIKEDVLSGTPCVIVEGEGWKEMPSVNVDQFVGAQKAVEYLIALGHTVIAHISGPSTWYEASKRREGWKKALRNARLELGPLKYGDWSANSGYHAIRELIKESNATAVFVANDAMALGVLKALNELKVKVPKDISVVGFDDIPESEFLIPGLTTIRQDFNSVGNLALELLMDRIGKKKRDSFHIAIQPELIIRKSTSPIASMQQV
ncbi:MAG: LacI family DNA-binding transcriptional regulator [Candidatus Planktophila sp.]|nr:LacI family DNA-binding transcriptional regulator [Candidatus Planktophila sp.]